METRFTIGERIRLARHDVNMTLVEVATGLGYNWSTVQSWEVGRHTPKIDDILHLSGVLDVSIMWLMTGDDKELPGFREEQVPVILAAKSRPQGLKRKPTKRKIRKPKPPRLPKTPEPPIADLHRDWQYSATQHTLVKYIKDDAALADRIYAALMNGHLIKQKGIG